MQPRIFLVLVALAACATRDGGGPRGCAYALLAAGEPGVRKMLDNFRTQITEGLAFLGAQSLDELDPSFLDFPANWPKR